jgi:hypothetical protein
MTPSHRESLKLAKKFNPSTVDAVKFLVKEAEKLPFDDRRTMFNCCIDEILFFATEARAKEGRLSRGLPASAG